MRPDQRLPDNFLLHPSPCEDPSGKDRLCLRSTHETHDLLTLENGMAKTNLIPLGDRVVLQRAAAEETTAGGIVLPDSARDKPQRGTVIAVGDGHVRSDGTKIPLSVKEGDSVIFSPYGGEEISVGDDEYLLLRESDILATT
jgi:chaperonin GroES